MRVVSKFEGRNYLSNVKAFIANWDSAGALTDERNALYGVSAYGNINTSGDHAEKSAPILCPAHPKFFEVIEPGVHELVRTLVGKFNLITYTSCEGHSYPEGIAECNERNVGILPRSNTELEQVIDLFWDVEQAVELLTRNEPVYFETVATVVESDDCTFPAVDIFFRKRETVPWDKYFAHVDQLYMRVVGILLDM